MSAAEYEHRAYIAESELAALRVELQAARDRAEQSERDEGEAWAQWNEMADHMAEAKTRALDAEIRAHAAEAALQAAQEALRWRESVTRDVIHGLRHQPEISREDIAGMLERDLAERAVLVEGARPDVFPPTHPWAGQPLLGDACAPSGEGS